MIGRLRKRLAGDRGSSLVEFAVTVFLLVMVILAVVEFSRMVSIYTDLADAARAGVRYAIVHGVDNAASDSAIEGVVASYAIGWLDTSQLASNVTVSYPNGTKNVGDPVQVTVRYAYDPFSTYFPLSVTLSSTSEGTIAF